LNKHTPMEYFTVTGASPQTLTLGAPGVGFAWALAAAYGEGEGALGTALSMDVNLRSGAPQRMHDESNTGVAGVGRTIKWEPGLPAVADENFAASVVITNVAGPTARAAAHAYRVRKKS